MISLFNKFSTISFILSLCLSSCQQQSEKEDQILHLNFQEGDVAAHPHLTAGHIRGRVIGKALFEGLTRINLVGEAELAGAESVQISPCQTQYIFTLRDHQWSDGTPVTAFQYEKAWKQAIAPASDCGRADLFYVIKGAKQAKEGTFSLEEVGVKALDDRTLSVKLAFAAPYFLKLIASPIFTPVERTKTEPSRFNGPFIIDKWNREDLLVLKANSHFWDHNQVCLKQIEIQMVNDPSTVFLMYEKQKIDWIGHPFCKLSSEMVTEMQEKGVLQQQPVAYALWVYLNTQSPTLASCKIRQALGSSIDRSLITKYIFPCNTPLYQPVPLTLSLCPNALFDNNLIQSKQLFEAGLREINFSEKVFPSLTLSYPNISGYKQTAEYLQETWGKVLGIKVFLEKSEWNVFRSHLEKGEFQIGISGVAPLYPDPSEPLERFTSTANFSQWENPIYQEKLNLAKEIPQKRTQFLCEAEQLLLEEMPVIPICNFNALFAHNPRLKGYVLDHAGCVDFRWASMD